jgi:hypothetical protein
MKLAINRAIIALHYKHGTEKPSEATQIKRQNMDTPKLLQTA